MSMTLAEQTVRKLSKKPANCICANCGTHKKLGFGSVCIKFHTFVCNNCKSSHQAISHRCKSLTMSSWSDAEVEELRRKGNDYARRTWLKNAPPVGSGGRPQEGDDVNVFKRFVVDVYESKRYYGEDGGAQQAAPAPTPQTRAAPKQIAAFAVPAQPPASFAVPASKPLPRKMEPVARPSFPAPAPPVLDLLDFSAPSSATPPGMFQANFDAFSSSPAPVASVLAPVAQATDSSFNFMNSAPSPAATTASSNFADFSGMLSGPAPVAQTQTQATASSSGFSFMNTSAPVASTLNDAFADFSGMSAPGQAETAPAVVDQQKKVVMGNMSLNEKASAISCMDKLPTQKSANININAFASNMRQQPNMMMQQQQPMQPQSQSMMGMQMNGGMNNNPMMGMQMNGGMNNNNPMMQQQMMQMQQQMQMMQMNPGINGGGMSGMQMGGNNMGMMNPNVTSMNSGGMNNMMSSMNSNMGGSMTNGNRKHN
jgi:hypothetical protein